MIRKMFKIFTATLFLMISGLAVVLLWLFMSSSGVQQLLSVFSAATPITVTAKKLEGRLADRLRITDLEIHWGEQDVQLEEMLLEWHPARVLKGRLDIDRLKFHGLHLHLKSLGDRNQEPRSATHSSDLSLPFWLRAEIKELHVDDFRVLLNQKEVFQFSKFTARIGARSSQYVIPSFSWISPYVHLSGSADGKLNPLTLNMDAEVGFPTELLNHSLLEKIAVPRVFPARIEAEGGIFNYRVRVTAGDREKLGTLLSGQVKGNLEGLNIEKLSVYWLGGTIQGDIGMTWAKAYRLEGNIFCRDLNPALLSDATWAGRINADILGSLELLSNRTPVAFIKADLHPSILWSRPLSGNLTVRWLDEGLILDDLNLQGDGLSVTARGRLEERIDFETAVTDLSLWLPRGKGELKGSGWLRWRNHYLTGDVQGQGNALYFEHSHVPHLDFSGRHPTRGGSMEILVTASQPSYKNLSLKHATLTVQGTPESHTFDLEGMVEGGETALKSRLEGSFLTGRWQGILKTLSASDPYWGNWGLAKPASFYVAQEGWSFSTLSLQGVSGALLTVEGTHQSGQSEGGLEMEWRQIPLQPLAKLLPETDLWGRSHGRISASWLKGKTRSFIVHLEGSGGIGRGDRKIPFRRLTIDGRWNQKGLDAAALLDLGTQGSLVFNASSPEPIHAGEPVQGTVAMDIRSFDFNTVAVFYPLPVPIEGKLNGIGQGSWSQGRNFVWRGEGEINHALMAWRTFRPLREELRGHFDKAVFRWNWSEDTFLTNWDLRLQKGGMLKGELGFPLASSWPVKIIEDGPLTGNISGQIGERGLLTAVFPDLIQESRGEVSLDITLGGTQANPLMDGNIALTGAGGHFLPTGIQLDDVNLHAQLNGRRARINQFQILSGQNEITGSGVLAFSDTDKIDYRLELAGQDFQVVDLPGLRMQCNPRLSLRGDAERLSIDGTVLLPEVTVSEIFKFSEVRSSRDAIVIRSKEERKRSPALDLDLRIQVELGEKAFVRAENFTGQLEGAVLVMAQSMDEFIGRGEIRIREGTLTAYGAKLEVKRGNINFDDVPLENPTLDVVALREIGSVQAGVQVTGTAALPEINLYSRPSMQDKDILAYILLGRPFRSDRQEADILAIGAGALLPQGPGFLRSIGFTEVDLGGLLSEEGAIRLRYRLRKNLEIESTFAGESGLDLFHIIEFD